MRAFASSRSASGKGRRTLALIALGIVIVRA
jgi:hypothetical protein